MSEKSDATMEMAETPEAKYLNPDNEMKTEEEDKKSALNYLLNLLSDSVVTGVPQIITVGHIFRKVFKLIILFACIAGFIYQAVEFMNLYYTYPSTIDIDIEYAKTLPAPKLTVCDRNPLLRSKFCSENPQYCTQPTEVEKFCKKYPQFCNETTTVEDLKFIISEYVVDKTEYVRNYGQTAEDLIENCCSSIISVTDECRKNSSFFIYMNEFNRERQCYTIDFSKFQKHNSLKFDEKLFYSASEECVWWTPFVADNIYTVVLDLKSHETSRPEMIPAAQIGVHSPNTEQNPFLKGFTAKVGKRYMVKLTANAENLLPSPFSTNCADSSVTGDDYSRDECLAACALKITHHLCGCAPVGNPLREDIEICLDLDEEKRNCAFQIDLNQCYSYCPRPCHSFSFDYIVSESDLQSGVLPVDLGDGSVSLDDFNITDDDKIYINSSNSYKWNDVTVINVLYLKPEINTFTYKPKYEKIEILGYIGGYSGIWLGISLVAIFDFFETLVVFVCFLCQRTKKTHTFK